MINKTAIVVVTYNGMTWLKNCLESCENHFVIVVDNHSTDGTIAFIESQYPKVKLFKQSSNLGFGKANNLGISYALSQGANHVFLLNQDAYLIDDCLEQLIKYQKGNPEYGILSPIHLTASKDKLDKNFAEYMSYKNNMNFYSDFVLKRQLQQVYPINFVNAAAWLLSRELLLTIGGFDPLFFHYGEDNNYCQRVLFHGFSIGVIPTAFIIHDRQFRTTIKKRTRKEILNEKEMLFKLKWGNVNTEELDKINTYKNKLKYKILISTLKLKFNRIKYYVNELKLINRIEQNIGRSMKTNKAKGNHYLSVD